MCLKKTSLMCALLFAHSGIAAIINKDAVVKSEVQQTLSTYKVCNVSDLAEKLSKQFDVFYMADSLAKYNYYMIRNPSELNADSIRKQTCQYIIKNDCFLFWGNIINMGMISQQKAAWFPADTSPHYILSPLITCNKYLKKN